MSSAGGMLAFILARKAKKEGRKPYSTKPEDWLKLIIILIVCLIIGYLVAFK